MAVSGSTLAAEMREHLMDIKMLLIEVCHQTTNTPQFWVKDRERLMSKLLRPPEEDEDE